VGLATLALLLSLAMALASSARADGVDPSEIITVLPPDAIPAITNPTFNDSGSWLAADARVVGVEVGGEARAYPIAILNWHEIVDDRVGGLPIAVTYCPLCGTGIVFERTVSVDMLIFKVSGKLYRNNLVMYDTATGSLWSQLLGNGILGAYDGTQLGVVTSTTIAWNDWQALHPDTKLLDRPRDANGDFLRNYNVDPYAGYDTSNEVYFPQTNIDPYNVLSPKELVLGVFLGKEARAYPLSIVSEKRVVNDVVGGTPLVVTYALGVMKAWERGNHTFRAFNLTSVQDEENRTYDAISGRGMNGSLSEVPAVTAYWFAWYDFYPSTTIYGHLDLSPRSPLRPSAFPSRVIFAVSAAIFVVAAGVLHAARRRRRGRR
jgi:Protein of unknown function (DUF3179)